MAENLIESKSKAFALSVIKLYEYLQSKRELVMSKQVLRSGTSIGANVSEGQFAQTRADFLSKYHIALKEAGETRYWLDLLNMAGYLRDFKTFNFLKADCDELIRLLASSVKTAKKNG